jgi:threonine/homoserine/homoserine lactone efflux protein
MFEIQNYNSFIMAILIFQAIPGPGTLAILNATARGGVTGGMRAVLGTLSGDFIYMLSAVLGLAALLSAYPRILSAAQWIGIAYLFWMGLKLLRTSVTDQSPDETMEQENRPYYRQAFAVSLTNPKVIMFFMAFFPLFLTAESGPVTLVALMIHVTAVSFLYQVSLVFVGNAVARYLSRWKYARLAASRLAGIAFIGFGVRLAFNNR